MASLLLIPLTIQQKSALLMFKIAILKKVEGII